MGRRLGVNVVAALAGVVAGILVILAAPGLVAPDPAVVAWEQELTGVVAASNDLVALEFLPAVLGTPDLERSQDPPNQPDFPRVRAVCEQLRRPVARLGPLVRNAPVRHARTAELVHDLASLWERALDRCEQLTMTGDLERFRTGLHPLFVELGELTAKIGTRLPHDVQCPAGLDPRPRTCDAGVPIL